MFKRLFFLSIIITQAFPLNARYLDVAIFLDRGREVCNPEYIQCEVSLSCSTAICQKNFPILTTSSILYNIYNLRQTEIINDITKTIKALPFNDNEWDIYKHWSGYLYLLIPKTYINALQKYNTKEFKTEASKYSNFTSDEILTGFRISNLAGIFDKVFLKDLNTSNIQKTSMLYFKDNRNWLEIFTQGTDDIFGMFNVSLIGHGWYIEEFLSKINIPKEVGPTSFQGTERIAGMNFAQYQEFIQFLTNKIKTNFLYYVTCFGGDINLVLPYITTVLNNEGIVIGGIKKPNFTIAAGALTNSAVKSNFEVSLLGCTSTNITEEIVNYAAFFEALKQAAPDSNKAVIYKDLELQKILKAISGRTKGALDHGITGLASVMFPGSDIFRVIALDDTIAVINEVFLKKHTLTFKDQKLITKSKPIILKDKEVILIYPLEIPVPIKIIVSNSISKIPPAIVSMTIGMSIQKIKGLHATVYFTRLLQGSFGEAAPVLNKYFFINSLSTWIDSNILPVLPKNTAKLGDVITLKHALIRVNKALDFQINADIIFKAPNNIVYVFNSHNEVLQTLNIAIKNPTGNVYVDNLITYFDSNEIEIQKLREQFDFVSLLKLLTTEEKELLQKYDKPNGIFNTAFKEIEKQDRFEKEKKKQESMAKNKAVQEKIKKEKDAKNKLAKDKADKDKIAKNKAAKEAKDKSDKAAKEKANKIALEKKGKQFKNTSTKLLNLANVFQEFKQAQANKNAKKINQLKKKVNQAQQNLKKLNVNIKNSKGQTPIMVNPRITPIVYGLNKKVAKNVVNAKDPKGKTVLQYTIQSPAADKIYIYNALVSSGARITNNDIKTVQNKLKNKPKIKNQIVKLLQTWQKKNK